MIFNPKKNNLNFNLRAEYKKLEPLLSNKRNATYFAAILTFLTMSFFGVFAIRPTLTTAVSLNKEIQDLNQLKAKYEEKIVSIVQAQSEYEKIRDDIPLFYATLPQSPDFTNLIIKEEQTASVSNMNLDNFLLDPLPISKPKGKGQLVSFNLSLSLIGDYNNGYNYLNHFLRSQRIVSIDDLDLSQGESTIGGKIRINIKAKGYYEP